MRHVVVIGPMGVGKTTVGDALAARLERPFVDADEEFLRLHASTGADVAQSHGVDVLHAMEMEVFRRMVSSTEPSVIAAAASVIDTAEGRDLLHGEVSVWLDADVATLATRSSSGGHRRPLDPAERSRLREERSELAFGCTVATVDAAGSIEECVEAIVDVVGGSLG